MKKVVIIGGGFAGSYAAKKLEREFDVALIDSKDYFEFTPGVLRTIVEPEHVRKIQVLHSRYLRLAEVVVGKVKEVSDEFVKVNGKKIYFDYLVICSGSRYEMPFKEQGAVIASRTEHLRKNFAKLRDAKKIMIVGGGLVGVELASEIFDKYDDKEVTIVHSGERLIERNSEKAIAYAEKYLKSRGAKIVFGEKVEKVGENFCLTDRGRKIESDLVFLCTGIKPNFEFLPSRWINEKGICVNEFLQAGGKEAIFAAGDVVSIDEEKTAQNAQRQAKIVVKNILALESGQKLKEYSGKRTPQVISLGKRHGIFDSGKFVLTGWIPAVMKWGIMKKEMWKRR
jgi:apoptosis-inducing factor 2